MTRLPDFPVEGGCIWGAVRYRLTASPLAAYACHCHDCQRETSGPYSVGIIVRDVDLHALTDAPLRVYEKPAESGREVPQFSCAKCGTRMWQRPKRTPGQIILRAGTLDAPGWAVPAVHIWTASKLPWVRLEPDAMVFGGALPDRELLYAAWQAYARR